MKSDNYTDFKFA